MRRLVVMRHGYWERNERVETVGAASTSEQLRLPDPRIDYMVGLMPQGREQGRLANEWLAQEPDTQVIDYCLYSPYARTGQMARLAIAGKGVPMCAAYGLVERNMGVFTEFPSDRFRKECHEELAEKRARPLDWRPDFQKVGQILGLDYELPDEFETLRESAVAATPVLERAHEVAPDGTVLFLAHSDKMNALRSRADLTGMTNTDIRKPYGQGLPVREWIQNAQADLYYFGNEPQNEAGSLVTHFRSVSFCGEYYGGANFDTGLVPIAEFGQNR